METPEFVHKLIDLATAYGLRIIEAIIIFIVGRWIAKGLTKLLHRAMIKADVDRTLTQFVTSITSVVLLTFVVISALHLLGIPTASMVAVLGAAGLAIGLALQGSLSNFAAGVLMIIFKPFQIGDYIEGAGAKGTVEEIEIFTTQICTNDNKTVIIPNANLMGDNIINYTVKGIRRVDMSFGIGYGDDIDKARGIIQGIIDADKRILKAPASEILVSELADSSVNLTTRAWSTADDYWGVKFTTTEAVKKQFDAEGINIPFPQRDVHVYRH